MVDCAALLVLVAAWVVKAYIWVALVSSVATPAAVATRRSVMAAEALVVAFAWWRSCGSELVVYTIDSVAIVGNVCCNGDGGFGFSSSNGNIHGGAQS